MSLPALGSGRPFIFWNSVHKKEHGLRRAQNPKQGPRRQRGLAAVHLDTLNVGRKTAGCLFVSSMEWRERWQGEAKKR